MSASITAAVAGAAGKIAEELDELFTSDEERTTTTAKLQEVLMKPQVIAALTTLKEAEHPNWFVAGWRPALGWICALAIAGELLLRPTIVFLLVLFGAFDEAASLPSIDMPEVLGLLGLLLGVAGYRTFEKLKGIARS